MSGRQLLKRVVITLLVVCVTTPALAVLYLIYLFDWNTARASLSRAASENAGRKIVIQGDVDIDWGWPVSRGHAEGIAVDNLEGGSSPLMFELTRIEAAVDLRSLLKGDLAFTELMLVEPRLLLEKTAAGRENWDFGDNPAGAVALAVVPENRREFPIIKRLSITGGQLIYKDPAQHTEFRADAATIKGATDDDARRIQFKGEGKLQGQPFHFEMSGGSVLELRDSDTPYPVSISIVAGDTQAKVNGTVTDPITMKGLDVSLNIRGANAADLFPLTGIALLPTPPYAVVGRLGYVDGVWTFRKFTGRMGESDLAGDLRWDVRPKRPVLTGSVTSRKLDLADLAGFIGASRNKHEARVLPDVPLDISRLAAMDAAVDFHGVRIVSTQLPLDDLHVNFKLKDRLLRIAPVRFGSGKGDIVLWVTINAREAPPQITSRLALRRVPIAGMFKAASAMTGDTNLAKGSIGGTADLTGTGHSLHDLLASSNGHLGIGMEGGQLSLLIVELIGLDVAESVGYLLAGDQPVPIRCVIADFDVVTGRMTPRALMLDTEDTVVTGTGEIDLKDESLNLELKPAPKDFSPLTLRAPLAIGGTFKTPKFHVKPAGLLARGAVAAVLGLIFPPAALLAFVEPGLGEDGACVEMLAEMAARSKQPERNASLIPNNR